MTIKEIKNRIKEIETKKGYVSNEEIKELIYLRNELVFRYTLYIYNILLTNSKKKRKHEKISKGH